MERPRKKSNEGEDNEDFDYTSSGLDRDSPDHDNEDGSLSITLNIRKLIECKIDIFAKDKSNPSFYSNSQSQDIDDFIDAAEGKRPN